MDWNKLAHLVMLLLNPFFIALIGSITIFLIRSDYAQLINEKYEDTLTAWFVILSLGSFFPIVCSCICSNTTFACTFTKITLGFLIIGIEVICVISAWVLKDGTEILFGATVYQQFRETFSDSGIYVNDSTMHSYWANIQSKDHCCGLRNYTDFYHIPNDDNAENFTVATIPLDCCQQNLNHTCAVNVTSDLYQIGCAPIIYTTLTVILTNFCYTFCAVCSLQVIGLTLTAHHAILTRRTPQGYQII